MGRLIDAGLFLDNLSGRLESIKDYDAVKDVINNMPTAYDPDKVVKQLEEEQEKLDTSLWAVENGDWYAQRCNGINDGLEKAIEIAKGGGVDAN